MRGTRAALIAAALAVAVHLPSLSGAFLYDDVRTIVENRTLRDLSRPLAILRFEPARPLLTLTWALNYAAGGLRPWSYHLVNVLVHAGNAALLASLFLWMARRSGRRHPEASALLGACLFAVTPMAAETVAYVSSRSTALASLFTLAALRVGAAGLEGRRRRLGPAFALFVAGLLVKEEAACFPLLFLLLDAFFVARLDARDLARRARLHAPFLLVPVAGLLARRSVVGAWLPAPAHDTFTYLWTQLTVLPAYVVRAVVPFDPAFFRGVPLSPWPPDAAGVAWAGLALAALTLAVVRPRRWPEASFALLWFVAALLPSSSVVALREIAVDHRAYLAGAGVLYALAGVLWAPGRLPFAVAILALMSARSVQYQRVLGDPVRAWEDAVARAPFSIQATRALASAYAEAGDPRAEQALLRAASLAPGDPRTWANLGAYYLERQRLDAAEQAWRRAVVLAPTDARLRDNLGAVLEASGQLDAAVVEYEAARRGLPPLAQPRIRLAEIALRRGEAERTRALLDEATRLEIDEQEIRAIQDLQLRLLR